MGRYNSYKYAVELLYSKYLNSDYTVIDNIELGLKVLARIRGREENGFRELDDGYEVSIKKHNSTRRYIVKDYDSFELADRVTVSVLRRIAKLCAFEALDNELENLGYDLVNNSSVTSSLKDTIRVCMERILGVTTVYSGHTDIGYDNIQDRHKIRTVLLDSVDYILSKYLTNI